MANGIPFDKIDKIFERIRKYAREPEYTKVVQSRERTPDYDLADHEMLRGMIEVIAFSQAVPAARVRAIIDRGIFRNVFGTFDPAAVARMDPAQIKRNYWDGELSGIRFPDKIPKMVECAVSLAAIAKQHGSLMKYLKSEQFPEKVCSNADIDKFWSAFERACDHVPPYFQRNFVSMCHLLQSLQFPCAKPDKVVMTVAADLGIVNPRNKHPERELRYVVRQMQAYASKRGVSVPVVDLIFLIHGKQTEMKALVEPSYHDGRI
jgi:hypothetical protein